MKRSLSYFVVVLLVALVAFSQLTCRSGQSDLSGQESGRVVTDCFEFVSNRAAVEIEFAEPYMVVTFNELERFHGLDEEANDARIKAFFDFMRLYGPSAQPLMDRGVLEDFAEDTLVSKVLDYAGVSTTEAEIEKTFSQIRGRFPSDAAFDRFQTAVGADTNSLKAAICRDLRIESYLRRYLGEPEIDALQTQLTSLYSLHLDADEAEHVVYQSILSHLFSRQFPLSYEVNFVVANAIDPTYHEIWSSYDSFVIAKAIQGRLQWHSNDKNTLHTRFLPLIDGENVRVELESADFPHTTVLDPDGIVLESQPGRLYNQIFQSSVGGQVETKHRGVGVWSRPLGTVGYRYLYYRTEANEGQIVAADDGADSLTHRVFTCGSECPVGQEARRPLVVKTFSSERYLEWQSESSPERNAKTIYYQQCVVCHGDTLPSKELEPKFIAEAILKGHQALSEEDIGAMKSRNDPLQIRSDRSQGPWPVLLDSFHENLSNEELAALVNYISAAPPVSQADLLALSCSFGTVGNERRVAPEEFGSFIESFDACEPQINDELQREGARISAEQRELGRSVYEAQCASCHGITGAGEGPAGAALGVASLLDPEAWQHGASPADVLTVLFSGIPGSAMPAYYHLDPEELLAVAYYVSDFHPESAVQRGNEQLAEQCRLMSAMRKIYFNPCDEL